MQSTMLEGRLNNFCILSVESDIKKCLTYEEAIKEYATKNVGKMYYRGVSGS
jgi:hypothetical protein